MSAIHDGRTPRRTTRRATATPVRDLSPSAHNTRAGSTAVPNTPATRRSTRNNSRKPDQAGTTVNNATLPEIQTRQSYAYGSSKTPLLPEQLHARDSMTMRQVADQMNTAIQQADRNLDAHAADTEESRREPQLVNANSQANPRGSKEPSPPVSITTDVQKKRRTAAWASSLEGDPLEDIPEEEHQHLDTPETRRTEPSSFPSGIFDQSYQYERGLRPPRKPPKPARKSFGARLGAVLDYAIMNCGRIWQALVNATRGTGRWISRLFNNIFTVILELPESGVVSAIAKALFTVLLLSFVSYMFCFGYSRYLCDPFSTNQLAQSLQSWCGTCQSTRTHFNISSGSAADVHQITNALRHIDSQIRSIESRINLRVDSEVAAIHTNIDTLRQEQSDLVDQLQQVASRSPQETTHADSASTFIPKINFFSPANGAIINIWNTSPTRQVPMSLPWRVAARMFGVQKYKVHNPIQALEPWHDVGDCWCAAATAPDKDSILLGVSVREFIYPTELVIEHPPKEVSLMPETAPKVVELWADFSHLSNDQWQDLVAQGLQSVNVSEDSPFEKTFALVGFADYQLASHPGNVQTFAMGINQHGDLKYAAQDYAVRVRSTHGGEYGCLYRVRLHGVPAEGPQVIIDVS